MTPGNVAVRLGHQKTLMKGGRGRRQSEAWDAAPADVTWPSLWALAIAALVVMAASAAPAATAASGVELILGKQRPSTPAPSADPSAAAAAGERANGSDSGGASSGEGTGNNTKPALTGVPQVDYVLDPNLPRELNGYNLSAYPFYDRVPEDMEFSCDGLHDGFYASVPHKCQVYHHCLYGTRYDFLCANYTAFDQKTFICHFVSEVDCENSPKYFNRNEALYKATTTSTAAPPRTTAPAGGRRGSGRGGGGGGRRRPAGGAGGRGRPYYDYEYDDQDYEDYDEGGRGGGGARRPQGGASEPPLPAAPPRAVFERPRVAPKVRRPVPLSERDKYEYSGASPAPATSSSSPPPSDVTEDSRSPTDGDRDRPKPSGSGNSNPREEDGYSRTRAEPSSASRPAADSRDRDRLDPRDRPDSYNRRPMDSGYNRHRDNYRPSSYSRDRPRDRRPYRRRPSEEDDDYYYYYDGEDDEEDYRRRRPSRPRARPRPRRPPPRYRDEYEDEEYEDEEEDEYARPVPVPAPRPAYVTAPGGGGSRRPRPRAPPQPRRPNRHSTRYADEDDYYYDEDEDPVEFSSRPSQPGAQRRRGRPTAPAAPAPAPPPASQSQAPPPRRRYPDDSLEEVSGPAASAPAAASAASPARRPSPSPLQRPAKSPSTTTLAPPAPSTPASAPSGLRGKLVEVRRHPLRNPPSSTSPPVVETSPESLRSRLEPRPPEGHDVYQDLSQDLKQKWGSSTRRPEPVPDVKHRATYESQFPHDFDYDSESWAHYESRMREGPPDLLRTRDPVESEPRQRFEPRIPSRGESDPTRPESDSRQRYESRNPVKQQNYQYAAAPKPSVRTPIDEETKYESRSKFSPRGELESRPSKPPPRTPTSEVKFSNGRGGTSAPAVEEPTSVEEQPRQRFEPRTPGKYALRPQASTPAPDAHLQEQDSKAARPPVEEPPPPPPTAPERFAGKFLSRSQPSDFVSKYNNRQQSPVPPPVDVPQPLPPANRQPELPKSPEANKYSFGRGEPVKTRIIQLTKSVSPQVSSRIPDTPKFVQKPFSHPGRRGNFGRPDRLNLAEAEELGEDAEDNEEEEEEEDIEEEDEAINDALHPRPRPLRADATSVANTPVATVPLPPPPTHGRAVAPLAVGPAPAPQALSPLPPSAPALGSLLRLTGASTAPRRIASSRPPAPPSTQSRFRAAPESPGFTQQAPLYDIYYAY